jgi:translocation and assembly module TamA
LAGSKNTYGLLSFPGFLTYDTRDDVLDTRKGIYANVNVTPYTETFGDGGQFIKTQAVGQTYLSSNVATSPTLALKLAGGSISGGEGSDIPSDLRFYAGGGGSVRGYGYQTLGPRQNNTPVGGNSFITASVEGRLRFTEDLGGVIFADAGNVYDSSTPKTGTNLYSSAGIGVRYFTAIGPLRADVAIPLNGEEIGAPAYGLYISIGQSF